MKLPIFLTLATFGTLLSVTTYAQYEEQVVKFSQAQNGASARIQALGNAQTALGGDISSISGNPAGLGLFTKSEVSFSPTLNNKSSNANYFGESNNTSRSAFGLDQAGAVFYSASKRHKGQDLEKGWLSVNFGIAYNKTQNFNNSIRYQGTNPNNSVTDYFAFTAQPYVQNGNPSTNENALNASPIANFAHQSYLIDYRENYNGNGNFYTPAGDINNVQVQHLTNSGSQSELGFGIGANYENKIYIGGSLNFANLNYTFRSSYDESGAYIGTENQFVNGQYTAFYDQNSIVKGSGINLKFGAIFRPNNDLKLGLSFATPTWYRINENYGMDISSNMYRANGTSESYTGSPDNSNYTYNIRTPYKISGGISYIIAKQAILSADIDFIDYKSANFTADDFTLEQNTSNFIQNSLQATANYRVGAEVKLTNEFMIRGGFNYRGSPYVNAKITASTLSGGLGYRNKGFALDLTYANTRFNSEDSPYHLDQSYQFFNDTGGSPFATVKNNIGNFVMTLGFSF